MAILNGKEKMLCAWSAADLCEIGRKARGYG
jgi:hypothetical protein